jgi:Rps23 Pro-64 3,4-dihydroxylase Tpa1-like proline 4-hydroxylase
MNGQKLTDLKEQLFSNGFVSFNVKDLSEELYDELQTAIPVGSLNPNQFTNLQNTIINVFNKPEPEFESTIIDTPFETLNEIKDNILKNYNFDCGYGLDQIWFYSNMSSSEILDFKHKLYSLFYDKNTGACGTKFTLYNDGCYLQNHQDASFGGRHCAMLIYLSNDWDETKGGELVIDNTHIVPPIYGNVAILDFTKFNPYHSVNPVNGFDRYCLLNFCNPIIEN